MNDVFLSVVLVAMFVVAVAAFLFRYAVIEKREELSCNRDFTEFQKMKISELCFERQLVPVFIVTEDHAEILLYRGENRLVNTITARTPNLCVSCFLKSI